MADEPFPAFPMYSIELAHTVKQLATCQDMASLVQALSHGARRVASADGATVVLRDGDHCHYIAEDALSPLWTGKRFPLSRCISGWVMLNRLQVGIRDIYGDARIPHEAYRPTFVKSLVMTPVRSNDPIAAIGAYWSTEREASEDELIALQALADSAAVAISNVRLIEELKAENRRRDRFIAAMSHELRNPLTPMLNCLHLLAAKPDDEVLRGKTLEIMARQVGHMSALVEDLLQVSRYMRGEVELKRELVDIGVLLQHAVEDSEAGMASKRIRVVLQAPQAPVRVNADPVRLRQVFANLLQNAENFTQENGEVTIALEGVGNHVRVSIRDNGVGIPNEQLNEIFGTLKQPDAALPAGLGLGLALSKAIVELHGGAISAFSAGPGLGCEISVSIPNLAEVEPQCAVPLAA